VGLSQLRVYFGGLRRLLRPGGRLLNHAIARPPNAGRTRFQPNSLEASWDEAVAEVGPGRARVWRLYMAASALNFEAGRAPVHQVLAVRSDGGRSEMPLRPRFEERPLQR
jgi:cyclopropane-fatty-acyl-phospholipid synthase